MTRPRTRMPAARAAWGTMAVSLLVALVAVCAVEAQLYERALTAADIERLIPVLRADLAVLEQQARQAADREAVERARAAARQEVVAEIARGADPLHWLQAKSKDAIAPSTAVYNAPCSRALTGTSGTPSAVLSFGVAAPPAWLAIWKQRDPRLPLAEPPSPPAARPVPMRADALAQQARTFYSGRKFDYQGELGPFEWLFLGPDRQISATVMGVNVLGRVEPCRALASGPTVVLKGEGEMFAGGPARPAEDAVPQFHAALENAGLREQDYLNLKLQLLNARRDAASGVPQASSGATTGAAESAQTETAIRQRNAEIYRRFAGTLDPLLLRLQ